jgi:hypothetical protein
MTTKRKRTRRNNTAIVAANTIGLAYLHERVHAAFDAALTAFVTAAVGIRHIYEKDPGTGQWARVTDPDAIAAVLNTPQLDVSDHRIVIYQQDPDARLLEALLAVAIGAPVDPDQYPALVRDVEVNAETGELTVHANEDLPSQLRGLRDALASARIVH